MKGKLINNQSNLNDQKSTVNSNAGKKIEVNFSRKSAVDQHKIVQIVIRSSDVITTEVPTETDIEKDKNQVVTLFK